jgi:hypothetical protein
VCAEGARTCAIECPDADDDGHTDLSCGGRDCDDADPERAPGRIEICDPEGHDEDCDPDTFGEVDLDEDGALDSACCNGARCGSDCDDTRAAVRPGVAEVCNGSDDDCDAASDEGFECSAGDLVTERACRTSCGSLGAQTCTATCVYSRCSTADEGPAIEGTCNRCDDDGDGSLDEGFACVQGAFLPCTTACGSPGIGFCSASCEPPAATPAECTAAVESCNYCDDDGDGTYEDDRGLVEPAPVRWTYPSCTVIASASSESCDLRTISADAPYEGEGLTLVEVTTTEARGQAWATTTARVGWGTFSADVTVVVDAPGPGLEGGWAIVLATNACGDGPTNELGVPLDCRGLAVEHVLLAGGDVVQVRRLDGDSGPGLLLGQPQIVSDGIEAGSPSGVAVRLRVRYTPDLVGSDGDETAVRVEQLDPLRDVGTTIFERRAGFGIGTPPSGELRIGDTVRLGVTAGSAVPPLRVQVPLSARFMFTSLAPPTLSAESACAP